jgi:hypothetical protein
VRITQALPHSLRGEPLTPPASAGAGDVLASAASAA